MCEESRARPSSRAPCPHPIPWKEDKHSRSGCSLASHSKQARKSESCSKWHQPGLSPRLTAAHETGAQRCGSGSRSPRGLSIRLWGLVSVKGRSARYHTAPPPGLPTKSVSVLPRVQPGCFAPTGPSSPLPGPWASGSPWEAPRVGWGAEPGRNQAGEGAARVKKR